MFEIISLSELLERLEAYDHKELHVHHTWKPAHKSFNGTNHLQLQQNMRNHHMNVRGWQDIGQHVSLMPDGLFVTGRVFSMNPASITGKNDGAFACEMVGNFDVEGIGEYNELGYDKFEGKQKESALLLAAHFAKQGKYIRFHNENSVKTCPGTSIIKTDFLHDMQFHISLDLLSTTIGIDKTYWLDRRDIDPYFSTLLNKIALYVKQKG